MAISSSLSHQEFSSIVAGFDRRYFRVQPRTKEEQTQLQLLNIQLSGKFNNELKKIPADRVSFFLTNSVSDLFMFYRPSRALQGRINSIQSDDTILNRASQGMLNALGQQPTREEVPLRFFNQLMTHVLKDHLLNALDENGRLALIDRITGTEWVEAEPVHENSISDQARRNLLMNRTGWDWVKIQLQLTSWKAQLMFANFLTTSVGRYTVMAACFITAIGIGVGVGLLKGKLEYYLKNLLDDTYYGVVGRRTTPSLTERVTVISKTLAILASPFVTVVLFVKFVYPYLPLGVKNGINQGMYLFAKTHKGKLTNTLTKKGLAWSAHVSESVKQAAAGAKQEFALKKWNEISLHPERLQP
ncbi:MAG: hypothetical protein ABSA17_03285 [Rhabdochlamydiaceae bacterium]|jgi:hypothetical protein